MWDDLAAVVAGDSRNARRVELFHLAPSAPGDALFKSIPGRLAELYVLHWGYPPTWDTERRQDANGSDS